MPNNYNLDAFSGIIDPTETEEQRTEKLLKSLGVYPMVKTDTDFSTRRPNLTQLIQEEQVKNLTTEKPSTPLRKPVTVQPESTKQLPTTPELQEQTGVQQSLVRPDFFETEKEMPDAVALGLIPELEWNHATESRKNQLQSFLDAPNPQMPFLSNKTVYRQGNNVVSGALRTAEGIAGAMEWISQADPVRGQTFKSLGNQISEWAYGFEPRDKRTFTDDVFSGLGSMLLFLAPAGFVSGGVSALGFGTKVATALGMSTMTTIEAMTEAGQIYRETGDNEASTKSFMANIVLIGLTNKFGLGSETKNLIKKALLSAGNEGIQEGGQEIISALSKGEEIDWDSVIRSAGVGSIIGGGMSVVSPTEFAGTREEKRDTPAGNRIFNQPLKEAEDIATKYSSQYRDPKNPPSPPPSPVRVLNKDRAKEIAQEFEMLPQISEDPQTKKAYKAMVQETEGQLKTILDAGYKVEINNEEPYANSQEMIDDLKKNKRLKIFSTESGYGDTKITEAQRKRDVRLQDSGYKDVNGKPLLNNDVFRFVHDFFGHAQMGNSFGAIGEENAWRIHSKMYSDIARRAMTTETRGQNSWVNFSGVNDESFKYRDEARALRKQGKVKEAEELSKRAYETMKFADQKMGLLPEKYSKLDEELDGNLLLSADSGLVEEIATKTIKDGGSTTDKQGNAVKAGFSVATHEGSGKIIDGRRVTPQDIQEFIQKNKAELELDNRSLGTWYDADNNKIHLDVITVVPTEKEAQKIARENNQISIYDLGKGQEIKTKPATVEEELSEQANIPKEHQLPIYQSVESEEGSVMSRPSEDEASPLGDMLSDKWGKSVQEARKRLDSGDYGNNQLNALPVGQGAKIIQDIATVTLDYLLRTNTPLGRPADLAKHLANTFGKKAEAWMDKLDEIYQMIKDLQSKVKKVGVAVKDKLKEQGKIPEEFQTNVYRYSSKTDPAFLTDPKKFGQEQYAKNEVRLSPVKRTAFYTSPEQVYDDTPAIRDKNLYQGVVDARTVYDITEDPEGLAVNEYGIPDVDLALTRAKKKGYAGVTYDWVDGKKLVAMFKPVAVERPNVPSLGNILSGKWDISVKEAKTRINKGHYGTTSLGVNPVVAGASLIHDLAVISTDYLLRTKTPLGRPADFALKMFDIFGEQADQWRKYAREIYELVRGLKKEMDKSGLSIEQLNEVKETINKNLEEGTYPELSTTNKGVVVIGGDALDYEGGRVKAVGTRFPEDQAIRSMERKSTVVTTEFVHKESGLPMQKIENEYGSITFIEGSDDIMITLSGVNEDSRTLNEEAKQELRDEGKKLVKTGRGHGIEIYEDLIEYARSQNKTMSSDSILSRFGYGTWKKLMRKYPSIRQVVPDSELVVMEGTVSDEATGKDKIVKALYEDPKHRSIFRYLPVEEKANRRDKAYPVWATNPVVARQIEKEALNGNDTIVFMQYPNIWNAVKVNYEFQEMLNEMVIQEIEFNRNIDNGKNNLLSKIKVPILPDKEIWNPKSGTESNAEVVREQYYKEIQKAITEIKKTKTGRDEQKFWTQDSIALKFARENAINLAGKIYGIAKFNKVNYGERRIDPHKTYTAEIEGYNFRNLPEPIPFSMLQDETEGTDVGIRGDKMKAMKNKEREQFRRLNMFREMRQRGLVVNKGQSDLTDSLIQFANGEDTYLYEWLGKNPEWKDYIVDWKQHNEWNAKRVETDEQLAKKIEADLRKMLPDGFNSFINPMQMLKSLSVWGKAIARGTKSFGQWAGEMIKNFGEWVRPLLRDIWSRVTQMPNVFAKVPPKEAEKAQDPKNQVVKENVKDEEMNRKKDKTYSWNYQDSITKGYNEEREHPKLGLHIARMAEAVRKEFDFRRRGTISNDDLTRIAKDKASNLTDADILELNAGDIVNAEDVLAMRIYVTNEMLKISDEIAKFGLDATDPTAISSMSGAFIRVNKMWQAVRAIGTEMGRGVQSFNIPMDDSIIEAMKVLTDKLNKLDPEGRYGGDVVADTINDMTATPTDETEKKISLWEKARFVFLNFILSNPLTDMANIFGNSSNLTFHILANVGNLGGLSTLSRGIKNGFSEGMRDAIKVLHGEYEAISKFTEGSDVQVPSAGQNSKKNFFKLLVPTVRLGMEDAFFRGLVRNIELNRMTTKLSSKFGVAPSEIYEGVVRSMNDEQLAKLEPKYIRDLITYLGNIEDELVFQKELGKIGKGFSLISKVAFPIIPFVKTPANILKFGLGATPLGLVNQLKKDITKEERNQITRRALAGSVFMGGVATMVAQGLMEITGGGSDDEYERDLMAKMGYKPYHLYINTPFGKYGGSYMNTNPINVPLTIVGDLMDRYRFNREEKQEDKEWYDKFAQDASTALIGLAGSITEQSFLSGVRDFVDFLAGRKPDWGMRMLTNFGRIGLVTGIQRITGTEDRGQYDTRGRMMEQFQKNSPFSNDGLIPSISAFGEQRQSNYERFPIPVSEVKPEPQYQWLADNNLEVPIPNKNTKLGNREMTRREFAFYAQVVGRMVDKAITQMYEQSQDKESDKPQLTLEELQDKIDSAYKTAKSTAKKLLIEKIIEQQKLKEGNEND